MEELEDDYTEGIMPSVGKMVSITMETEPALKEWQTGNTWFK